MLFSREAWTGLSWLLLQRTARRALASDQPLTSRAYRSYESYVAHQRSKLSLLNLTEYDHAFRAALVERLKAQNWRGKSVLCLAARIGTEVKAFHDVGAFAVGIDLNPGKENSWVLTGDFHHLVFPDRSVDSVYCNALDHALDLGKTVKEIRRVLKPGGTLITDAQQGAEKVAFDAWAATSWRSVDDLANAIVGHGMRLVSRLDISEPWPGEQLTFMTD
ncbi:class I SAM-dependent methyltransferase [Micromonospora haikouensis]|uniref:class I SAM-dependent methyltransferase n=1 Tax=Micromonospora haikouensis TaxID=686309 RepID=UPI0034099FEA